MNFKKFRFTMFFFFFCFSLSLDALGSIKIITTTTNLASLAKEIGGEFVEVESLTKGSQDPHFVDAKPSFIIKASRADLLISVGLDLEIGWLPSILRGARNTNIMKGHDGSLILGELVEPIDVVTGVVSRDQGDVHPDGNPHFMLDPIRAGKLGLVIAKRLSRLDDKNKYFFHKRAKSFQYRLNQWIEACEKRILKSEVKEIFTYHKTLTYFLNRFGVKSIAAIEPKPGVPPTAGHMLALIKTAKAKDIKLVLVENYFEESAAQRIKKDVNSIIVRSVPVSVGGSPGVDSLEDLYGALCSSLIAEK